MPGEWCRCRHGFTFHASTLHGARRNEPSLKNMRNGVVPVALPSMERHLPLAQSLPPCTGVDLIASELCEAVVSVHQKRLTKRKLSLGIDVGDIAPELIDFAVLSAGRENGFA